MLPTPPAPSPAAAPVLAMPARLSRSAAALLSGLMSMEPSPSSAELESGLLRTAPPRPLLPPRPPLLCWWMRGGAAAGACSIGAAEGAPASLGNMGEGPPTIRGAGALEGAAAGARCCAPSRDLASTARMSSRRRITCCAAAATAGCDEGGKTSRRALRACTRKQ
eukprot:6209573-Pleurochrysis_carterae.AAC.3